MAQIENVSDTARWVAMYRAMETARPDAIFRDPFAERLGGERGKAILDGMAKGREYAWPMIVRTAVFDEIILDAVKNKRADLVLNLAAGLDARPWRMALPKSLRWVDADLPGILDYKLEAMAGQTPVCQYEAVRIDLRDGPKRRALFTQLGAAAQRVLVVSEGLLIYLPPEDVASLARDLHEPASFRWWLFDLASPRLLKMMSRTWGKTVEEGNAAFRFAPEESTKFFEPFGWKEVAFHSTMDEARRLKREMRGAWFWRLFGKLWPKKTQEQWKRFSGYPFMERV